VLSEQQTYIFHRINRQSSIVHNVASLKLPLWMTCATEY